MKKKVLLSVAATAALLLSSPAMDKADASSNTNVYYYQSTNVNSEQLNSILQKYLQQFQIKWNIEPVKSQEMKQDTSVQQQPQKESTVPTKEPVSSPTPVQQQPAQTETNQTESNAYQLSAYEQKVVELTNAERAKYGVSALKVDIALSKVAREKSADMQRNNYFSHNSPTYGSPFDMMKKFGVTYRTAGENIAMGQRSPEEVVKAWMNSEGHRKNILNASFTHIGVGHVANGNYWTQQFIGK